MIFSNKYCSILPFGTILFSLFIICLTLLSVHAAPSISIGSMYDVLTPSTPSLNKRIYNIGDSSAFVRVEVLEIDPYKNGNETETALKELQDETLIQERLLVTPMRLIIPPSGFQSVRILWVGNRDKERYFRIRFVPVMPEKNDSFGLSDKSISEYRAKTIKAGVNVLTGYGTLVIVQPEKPRFDTQINSNNKQYISVKNNGNTTITLEDIRHCRGGNTDCGPSSRVFILPSREYQVKKSSQLTTYFSLIEGNNKQAQQY